METTSQLQNQIIEAIKNYLATYTKTQEFTKSKKNEKYLIEQLNNLKPEDIILGDFPHLADVKYSGQARFSYHFRNSDYRRTGSRSFTTPQYYRALLNTDGKFVKEICDSAIYKQSKITPEYKYDTCYSTSQSLFKAIKSDIKDLVEDELYESDAFLNSLDLNQYDLNEITNEITIPMCQIAAKVKAKNGEEVILLVGSYSNFEGNEEINIYFHKEKKKISIKNWIIGIFFTPIIIFFIIYLALYLFN